MDCPRMRAPVPENRWAALAFSSLFAETMPGISAETAGTKQAAESPRRRFVTRIAETFTVVPTGRTAARTAMPMNNPLAISERTSSFTLLNRSASTPPAARQQGLGQIRQQQGKAHNRGGTGQFLKPQQYGNVEQLVSEVADKLSLYKEYQVSGRMTFFSQVFLLYFKTYKIRCEAVDRSRKIFPGVFSMFTIQLMCDAR